MSALRVAVGFKVTPDYEALRPADWARVAAADGPEARAEATRFVRRVLGVFDEAALELALRVRDARAERGLATELSAFSIGGREIDPFMQTLQALGYERACRVDAAGLDYAPAATAALVATCAEQLAADVLLLGAQSGPGDGGVVPFLVAEALGRTGLTQVTEIDSQGDGELRVTWADGRRRLRATVRTPAVLAVGNALVSMLRVPTLNDRLAARERMPEVITPAALGVDLGDALAAEPMTLLDLAAVERRRAGRLVQGASPKDKARALYECELRPRLERPPV